jgi:hypothetical protein
MTETHLLLLNDIRLILLIFNLVQELMSSERTPTLAVTLPAYELCLQALVDIVDKETFPHLNHAIYTATDKIEKYVKLARANPVYGISMCKRSPCHSWHSLLIPMQSSTQAARELGCSRIGRRRRLMRPWHQSAKRYVCHCIRLDELLTSARWFYFVSRSSQKLRLLCPLHPLHPLLPLPSPSPPRSNARSLLRPQHMHSRISLAGSNTWATYPR